MAESPDAAPLPGRKILWINKVAIPKTAEYRYLGSMLGIDDSLGIKRDIGRRVSLAHAAFGQLRHVWRSRQLSLRLKRELLLSCVSSVLLYGSELWTLDADDLQYLQRTWRSFLRNALCLSCNDIVENHISDLDLRRRLGAPSILTLLQQRLARWIGHLARLPVHRITRLLLFGTLQQRQSSPSAISGKRRSYHSRLLGLLQSLPDVDTRIWAQQAVDKLFWRKVVKNIQIAPQVRSTAPADRVRLRPQRRAPEQDLHRPHDGCHYVGRNLQGLNRHINAKHGQGGAWSRRCQFCNKEYKRKGAFTAHERSCPDKPGPALPDRPLAEPADYRARSSSERNFQRPDPHCGKRFLDLSQLNRHLRSQCLGRADSAAVLRDGKYMLPCPKCSSFFASTHALGVHKSRSH